MTDLSKHPCFNAESRHRFGRIHLPVAPRCNIQCNFCNRQYDCLNESRPGVTSSVLNPNQALAYLKDAVAKRPEIAVTGIAGPGDAFANPDESMETLRLIRKEFPNMLLCVATNGLNIGPYIDELAALKVSHVTLTINAVDTKIGAKVYAWIRDDKRPLRGEQAAAILIERQLDAIRRLRAHDIIVKVNSIIIPGINDQHIPEIAQTVANLDATIMNCMPMVPVQGAEFEAIPEPTGATTARLRAKCGELLPQMTHCARCRADAVGFIAEKMTMIQIDALSHYANNRHVNPQQKRPFVAVASREGALVNQHLGETRAVFVYEQNGNEFPLKEIRPTPTPGNGKQRWQALAATLHDCCALLVNAVGPTPQQILTEHGLRVVEMEGLVIEGLKAIYANQPIPASMSKRFMGCSLGDGCRGTGTGCG
ncbi:nitrogen fixation protein NifB [Achromatium sp. WMS3]|nr:nitrogen fixation protein NifB [Achromatium sp. WMS3]